eukprot:1096765-Prymnesium_polylepis.1
MRTPRVVAAHFRAYEPQCLAIQRVWRGVLTRRHFSDLFFEFALAKEGLGTTLPVYDDAEATSSPATSPHRAGRVTLEDALGEAAGRSEDYDRLLHWLACDLKRGSDLNDLTDRIAFQHADAASKKAQAALAWTPPSPSSVMEEVPPAFPWLRSQPQRRLRGCRTVRGDRNDLSKQHTGSA